MSGTVIVSTEIDKKADEADAKSPPKTDKPKKRRRRWGRILGIALLILIVLVVAARLAMPSALRWYVNRTIDQNPMYDGQIGEIDVHLYRGAYSIQDIRLNKTSG